MAQARAMIDVVGAEAGAHQLLEEVCLLVGAFRRAEAGERPSATLVAYGLQLGGCQIERLVPARLAEILEGIRGIHREVRVLRHAGLADEGLGEPLLVMYVVEAVAPLDAQPLVVGWAVAAVHVKNLVVLDR